MTLLSEMRDTVGLTLLDLGYDPSDFTMEQFDEAIAFLQQAVDSGQVRRFTGNDYGQDLSSGNVAACVAWTGDIVGLQADNPELAFNVPEAGATLWSDNFVIPIYSPRKINAEKLINFYFQPAIAAQAAAWINYITPVAGTEEYMQEARAGTARGSTGVSHRGGSETGVRLHGPGRNTGKPLQRSVRQLDGSLSR